MTQTVVLELPDETWRRLQQSARAARKDLSTFIVDRLDEATPASSAKPSSDVEKAIDSMAGYDDQKLWEIANSHLSSERQDVYEKLLTKNSQGLLSADEANLMHEIGQEARLLTAQKAQAFLLLKWRGYQIPDLNELD